MRLKVCQVLWFMGLSLTTILKKLRHRVQRNRGVELISAILVTDNY